MSSLWLMKRFYVSGIVAINKCVQLGRVSTDECLNLDLLEVLIKRKFEKIERVCRF